MKIFSANLTPQELEEVATLNQKLLWLKKKIAEKKMAK